MASTGLSYGPHKLKQSVIERQVESGRIGAYALGHLNSKERLVVLRVGRSDSDVASRLGTYVGDDEYKDCTHFKFDYFETARAAFQKECRMYHDFDPKLNSIHPARPSGKTWTCPVAGCDADLD